MVDPITVSLKLICKSSEILAKLIMANCVFKSSKLTRFSDPQLAIFPRSSLSETIVRTLEISLELVKGLLGNIVEECKIELSVHMNE